MLTEEVIFTKIQVRGSGLCLRPALGARTFPEFLRLPSSPHQVQTEQRLQNPLKCFPTANKNSEVFSGRHLTSPYFAPSLPPSLPTPDSVFHTHTSANCWTFKCSRQRTDHILTPLPSLSPLQPQPWVNTDTLHLSGFCFDLVCKAVKKPRIS